MDCPYNVKLSKSYSFENLTENSGFLLQIVLVDARNAIIKTIRAIGLPHEMSIYFKELVEKQRTTSLENYDTKLINIYGKFNTEDFVKEAKIYSI